ncbi:TetR/AcrR family transcriptional regulator [Streptomyces sp. NPDC005955]|uniref:TetR/AcrR family transcriptional regulator n=1 Tax=Streptomyces sp. NPDC005955 TaxID=3364738 RepID=UPI003682B660
MPSQTTPRPGRRPGPKPRLTRQKIVEAAVDLGIEQLSVQAVASALGVAPASLYRYVESLDDLVGAALEAVFRSAPLPDPALGWRGYLEAEAETRLDLLVRYAGLLRKHPAGLLAGIAARRFDRSVRDLVTLGFDPDEAVLAVDAVADLIHDGATQIARIRDPGDPERLSPELVASLSRYSPEVSAAVARIAADPHRHLRRKLALVLDGLTARHPQS